MNNHDLKEDIESFRKIITRPEGHCWGELTAVLNVIAAAERCEAAEALCAELRDALKPFSDEEKSWKMQGREDAPIEIGEKGFMTEPAAFSYKDLNRATCVLAKTPAGMGAELAALREDNARLDWLMDMSIPVNLRLKNQPPKTVFLNTRADIEAARKEDGK